MEVSRLVVVAGPRNQGHVSRRRNPAYDWFASLRHWGTVAIGGVYTNDRMVRLSPMPESPVKWSFNLGRDSAVGGVHTASASDATITDAGILSVAGL